MEQETAIDRLKLFVKYAKEKGVVKSENAFEVLCGLSNRYISNSLQNGKGDIGSSVIARIVDKFPELNVRWLCTGKGSMIDLDFIPSELLGKEYEKADACLKELESILRRMSNR